MNLTKKDNRPYVAGRQIGAIFVKLLLTEVNLLCARSCASVHRAGTVSIGGRTITNLRFADVIDGLAGEEEEPAKLADPQPTPWRSVPRGPS